MAITPNEYRELVKNIPERDVQSIINTSDATNGVGNEYSMFILNQYFNDQLPTQQLKKRAEEESTPIRTRENSTVPIPSDDRPVHRVNPRFAANPLEAEEAFDGAVMQKRKEFLASYKSDTSMTQNEKRSKAHSNALRYVRNWYDMPMTAGGDVMPMATVTGLQGVLAKQGLHAIAQALKPRTYSRNESIAVLQAQGETDPVAARKARKLMNQFQTGAEDEGRRMEVRTPLKIKATKEVKENWDEVVAEYLGDQGFEQVLPFDNRWRKTKTVELPAFSASSRIGATPEELRARAQGAPPRTETISVEIDAPKDYKDWLRMIRAIQDKPDPEAPLVKPVMNARGAKRKEVFDEFSEETTLVGIRDYINSRIDKVEDRIVGNQRQEDARSFYREAVALVRQHFDKEGIPLPDISRGKKGSEQRAEFDSLPKETRDNHKKMMDMAVKLGRRKTQEYDFVVYGDYLEEELSLDQEENRIGFRLPFSDRTLRINYKDDSTATNILGDAKDLARGVVFSENEYGDVAETFVGAGFRDLTGLIRFVTSPVFKAFTYDVDENGNPINTDDWNYRFDQWTNKAFERMESSESGSPSFGKAMRSLTDRFGTSIATIIPSRMAKTVSTGRRGRMNTGSYFQDVAVEIYNGRFLADDFNELVATRSYWEQKGMPWVPGVAGLGVEVALPLTPYPFAKSAIAAAGRTLQAAEESFRGARLSEFIKSLSPEGGPVGGWGVRNPKDRQHQPDVGLLGRTGRVMENPRLEAQVSILASVGRNIVRTARGTDEIGDLATIIAKEARLPRQLAVRLSGEIIELFDLSKDADAFLKSLEKVRGMHWGKGNTDMVNIIEDLAVVVERLRKVKKTDSIASLKADRQGQIIIDEIGAQSAAGVKMQNPEFMRGVLHGYLAERITQELVNYVPNQYILATGNVIVPVSKWKKHRKAIQGEMTERLKLNHRAIEADAGYIYENAKDASDLLVSAYGQAKITNTPFLKDVYKKLRLGKPLTLDEFTTIDQILRGSIVKSKITGSYRLTHTGAASERAAEVATGRQPTLPRLIEDFRRAVNLEERMFAYVKRNPTPPPAKIYPKETSEGVEISKLGPQREITDGFAQIDRVMREELLTARIETGDPWLAMTSVMQKYASDNPVDDIMKILFGKPGEMTGGFFGNTATVLGMTWDATKAQLKSHMASMEKAHGVQMNSFTPEAIIESIDYMRTLHPSLAKRSTNLTRGKDQPAGMGSRTKSGILGNGQTFKRFLKEEGRGNEFRYRKIHSSDTLARRQATIEHNASVDRMLAAESDYADAQVFAFIVDGMKDEIILNVSTKFKRMWPELTIPLSRPSSINESVFRSSIVDSLMGTAVKESGLAMKDPTEIGVLVDDIVKQSANWLFRGESNIVGGLNTADMRYMMNSIIKDIYDNGAMTVLSQQRIADIFYRRAGLKSDPGLVAVASRAAKVKEVVTAALQRHVKRASKRAESQWLPATPENVDELATLISGRIMSDFVESTTGQTIDTLMGNLSSIGLPARVDNTALNLKELQASLVQLGEDYAILMPRQTQFMVDSQKLKVLDELIQASAKGDLERNLQALRVRDEKLYDYYVNNIATFFFWTKRATIGGLLGGFGPFAALRFHGLNVASAPLIIAITVPEFALQAMKAIPDAALRFRKPIAEALYPTLAKGKKAITGKSTGAAGTFNWLGNKLANDPNKIMFVDKWGSPWSNARYKAAVRSNNIRFSQVTYEFRDSVLDEARRAVGLLPNLTKASYGKQILRWFDPSSKSIWTKWAEEADMAFRESVFAAALKKGVPEAQAAVLARNALLDYGAVPISERKAITKGMLFYAFKRQMLIETTSAFLRGGDSMRLLRAQMSFAMRQKQMMGTWEKDADWQKTRLYSRTKESFDGTQNALYGIEAPALGSLSDLINLAGGIIDFGMYATTDQPATHFSPGDVATAAHETFLAHPLFQATLDLGTIGLTRGTDDQPQGMLRPEWVYFFQNTGSWAIAEKWFDLEAVPLHKRNPNEYLQMVAPDGTKMMSQWRIGSKTGRMAFLGFETLTTVAGANRVMRDWSASGIHGDEGDDIVWKGRGEGNEYLHLFGLETPGTNAGDVQIVYTQAAKKLKALNSMMKE